MEVRRKRNDGLGKDESRLEDSHTLPPVGNRDPYPDPALIGLTAIGRYQLRACGVCLTFSNARRRFLAQLLHGAAYGLFCRRVETALNHGEQPPVFFHKVVAQPDDILPPALHDLSRVACPLKQAIGALVKGLRRLLAGIVFIRRTRWRGEEFCGFFVAPVDRLG